MQNIILKRFNLFSKALTTGFMILPMIPIFGLGFRILGAGLALESLSTKHRLISWVYVGLGLLLASLFLYESLYLLHLSMIKEMIKNIYGPNYSTTLYIGILIFDIITLALIAKPKKAGVILAYLFIACCAITTVIHGFSANENASLLNYKVLIVLNGWIYALHIGMRHSKENTASGYISFIIAILTLHGLVSLLQWGIGDYSYVVLENASPHHFLRVSSTFFYYGSLAAALGMGIFLHIPIYLKRLSIKTSITFLITAFALYLANTRGVSVCIVITSITTMGILLLFNRSQYKSMIALGIIALLFSTSIFYLKFQHQNTWKEHSIKKNTQTYLNSSLQRINLIKSGLHIILDIDSPSFWIGQGLGNESLATNTYQSITPDYSTHTLILDMFLTTGVFGGVLFSLFLITLLPEFKPKKEYIWLFPTLLFFILISAVFIPIQRDYLINLFFILSGIHLNQRPSAENIHFPIPKRITLFSIFLSIIVSENMLFMYPIFSLRSAIKISPKDYNKNIYTNQKIIAYRIILLKAIDPILNPYSVSFLPHNIRNLPKNGFLIWNTGQEHYYENLRKHIGYLPILPYHRHSNLNIQKYDPLVDNHEQTTLIYHAKQWIISENNTNYRTSGNVAYQSIQDDGIKERHFYPISQNEKIAWTVPIHIKKNLLFDFGPSPKKIILYRFIPNPNTKLNNTLSPHKWELMGSNNKHEWVLLDKRDHIEYQSNTKLIAFIPNTQNLFRYYRFSFYQTDKNTLNTLSLSDIELYSAPSK